MILWGFLTDVDMFRGMVSAKVRALILQRCQYLLSGNEKISEEEMNGMAELFIGRCIRGLISRLLRS